MNWDLALCLLLAWIICYLCVCKGVKSSGKVKFLLMSVSACKVEAVIAFQCTFNETHENRRTLDLCIRRHIFVGGVLHCYSSISVTDGHSDPWCDVTRSRWWHQVLSYPWPIKTSRRPGTYLFPFLISIFPCEMSVIKIQLFFRISVQNKARTHIYDNRESIMEIIVQQQKLSFCDTVNFVEIHGWNCTKLCLLVQRTHFVRCFFFPGSVSSFDFVLFCTVI